MPTKLIFTTLLYQIAVSQIQYFIIYYGMFRSCFCVIPDAFKTLQTHSTLRIIQICFNSTLSCTMDLEAHSYEVHSKDARDHIHV